MDWLKEIPFPSGEYRIEKDVDFSIQKIESKDLQENPDFINDIILQWVIAPFVVHENTAYRILVQDDTELVEYALTIFTNLFTKVRGIYIEGKLEEIRLEDLMPHIKNSFIELVIKENKIDPLVYDFCLKDEIERSNQFDVKLFQINREQFIEQTTYLAKPDHKRLWNFINRPDGMRDEMTISPANWVLNDRLFESPFLIFLSRYANEVVLTVNQKDLNVTMLSFK